MASPIGILDIPVTKTGNVAELAKWLEKRKVHEIKHPVIRVSGVAESPSLYLVGLFLAIGMALLLLEEKGKLKVGSKHKEKSSEDFLNLLKKSKSESSLEQIIESRYDVDISLQTDVEPSTIERGAEEYSLNNVFGIWKDRTTTLENDRQQQWGRKF